LLAISFRVPCQEKLSETDISPIEGGEGRIILNDGDELKGMIHYIQGQNIVSYDSGDVSNSRSMGSRNVVGFEFFDERLEKQRFFFALPYESGVPSFFEMIKDFGDFAILYRTDPPTTEIRQNYNSVSGMSVPAGSVVRLSHTKTIYFMDSNGIIKPYIQSIDIEIDNGLFERGRSKNQIVGKDIMQDYIKEPWYSKLVAYAQENDLKFKVKDDFLKILDYYEFLIKK